MNVADYIVQRLTSYGISNCFSMVGGHALFLNKAFADSKIKVTYVHNEQAATMAADGYTRLARKPCAVNVTSGPAALNALNGLYGAYVDNIPMVVISGQPKQTQTIQGTGLDLRQYGDQEFSYISEVASLCCKYAISLRTGHDFIYEIEYALKCAVAGKPGPVWIDVPMDIQGLDLPHSNKVAPSFHESKHSHFFLKSVSVGQMDALLSLVAKSQRPVLYLGDQLHPYDDQATALSELLELFEMPVVTEWNAHDLIETSSRFFCGRPGVRGERAGNWCVHASDLLIAVGSRLSARQIGACFDEVAPGAEIVMVDWDPSELAKPDLLIDLPILSSPQAFVNQLVSYMVKRLVCVNNDAKRKAWLRRCREVWIKYRPKGSHYDGSRGLNSYRFLEAFFKVLPEGSVTVLGNGISVVGAFQMAEVKAGQRIFQNVGCASMGYDIPASLGAMEALSVSDNISLCCVTGDGSFQLNIQELATVKGIGRQIIFFVINNGGYDSIRQSQQTVFGNSVQLHGVDEKTGLNFPDLEKLASAYELEYLSVSSEGDLCRVFDAAFSFRQCICEVFVSPNQNFEPKVATIRHDDGTISGGRLINMAPFLPEQEINQVLSFLREQTTNEVLPS